MHLKPIDTKGGMKILTNEVVVEKLQRSKTRKTGAMTLLWLAIPLAVGAFSIEQQSVQAQNDRVAVTLDLAKA